MENVTNEVYMDENGVYRWMSNDSVPPAHCEESTNLLSLPNYNKEKQKAARDADTDRILGQYIKMRQEQGYSEEEKAEMRSVFGKADVVDIFTGTRIHL